MATLPLPQTSPQGGPNPNSAPQPGLSVLDLPSFGGTVDGALTGNARAAAQANLRQQIAGATAPPQSTGLPTYDPSAPSLVATPANGVMGQGTGLENWLDARGAQGTFDDRLSGLRSVAPNTMSDIGNWLFHQAGGAADQLHQARSYAGATYARPEAEQYFSAHPSLLSAAEKDPVQFATKLGPILDAAVAAQNGTATRGTITHQTPDGMMVKPDDNVEHTNAVSKAFGVTPQQGHAMTQPHHYTDAEWLHATEGMTNNQLQQIWEMQHYLNPQQQAMSTALSIAQKQAQEARAANPSGQGMNDAERTLYQMLQIGGGLSVALPNALPAVK